jgi:hypothetical protein
VAWEVEYTDEFEAWWTSLGEDEQVEVSAKVELLEEHGPNLPRPHADVITSSRHANMKELRGKVAGRHLRVLYAFDPRRTALLLIGGDKTGDAKWYDRLVPLADELLDRHIAQLRRKKRK